MTIRVVTVLPAPGCLTECRLRAVVEDDALLALEAEEGARVCPSCLASARRLVTGARIKSPLRPAAARRSREGGHPLVPSTWGESLDRIALELSQAPDAGRRVLWIAAGPRPRLLDGLAYRATGFLPRMKVLQGRPAAERLAREARSAVAGELRGKIQELREADLVLAWGTDPMTGPACLRAGLRAALAAGAEIIAVDPRPSLTAHAAALHLPLRPGTDIALALTLASELLARGLSPSPEDSGGEDLSSWPARRGGEICGIDEDLIVRAAERIAGARRVLFLAGSGVACSGALTGTVRALSALAALSGGKILAPAPARHPAERIGRPDSAARPGSVGAERTLPVLGEGPPEADIVFVEGGDLVDWPEVSALYRHLKAARLVVVLSSESNWLCRHADLVLPVASHLEQFDVEGLHWGEPSRVGEPASRVPRETYPLVRFWRALARRMGWPAAWFPGDGRTLLEESSAEEESSLSSRNAEGTRFPPYRESGQGPLSTPAIFAAFPLQIVFGRHVAEVLSGEGALVGGGFRESDLPRVILAAEDARRRGIATGQAVTVHNEAGSFEALAIVSSSQRCGIVATERRPFGGQPGGAQLLPFTDSGTGGLLCPCLVEVGPGA